MNPSNMTASNENVMPPQVDTVTRTGRHKTYDGWTTSLTVYLQVGDSVCHDFEMHFLEVLPPAYWASDLIQTGEAVDHNGPQGRVRFFTLQKHAGAWIYIGPRTHGERVRIVAEDQSQLPSP